MIKKYSPLLIFLQEHWLPDHEATTKMKTDFPSYNFLTTSDDMFTPAEDLVLQPGPVWHGTAIGWLSSVDRYVSSLPIVNERFCGIQYKDSQHDITILAYSVYLPTAGKDDEFLEVLSALSSDILLHSSAISTLIIGCDSNQSEKSTKRRISAMTDMLEDFHLQPILSGDEPTFHHNNQTSESQIDNIYYYFPSSSSKTSLELFEHLCLKDNHENLSSHDVLVGKMILPDVPKATIGQDFSSTYTDFLVKKPKWSESGLAGYQAQTAQVLQEMFSRFNMVEHIPTLTEMCSKMLVISAEQNFETSNPKKGQPKQKK